MWYGSARPINLSVFPNAQMLYPAMGVMFAFMLTHKKEGNMPKAFYMSFIVTTFIAIACSVLSVADSGREITMTGGTVPLWIMAIQYVMIIGSISILLSSGKNMDGDIICSPACRKGSDCARVC